LRLYAIPRTLVDRNALYKAEAEMTSGVESRTNILSGTGIAHQFQFRNLKKWNWNG